MFEITWRDKKKFSTLQELDTYPNKDNKKISRVSSLYWAEHCVECALPDCYESCPLYNPREDKKCARFVYGIYPNLSFSGHYKYGLDINFERWAKLEAYWPKNPRMMRVSSSRAEQYVIDKFNIFGAWLSRILLFDRNKKISTTFSWLTEIWCKLSVNTIFRSSPDALYIKFYSPSTELRTAELEVTGDQPFFRKKIMIFPGWNELILAYSEFSISFTGIGRIKLWPSDDQPMRLIFTWLDLVSFADTEKNVLQNQREKLKNIKCVCWDLDNTLWSGVIGDDLGSNVVLNSAVLLLIQELDRRGIIQSIVSKNDFEIAWKKIKELNIEKYFLYPSINWGLKSEGIKSIAGELNIGLDSIAVIDDSIWEREEILTHLPMVRTFDPEELGTLLSRNDFMVPVTKESMVRRKMYQEESSRKVISENWGSDFYGFLQTCEMEMKIFSPNLLEHQERSLELLQRTNQFNLSGRSYDKESFDEILRHQDYEHFCIKVKDKFGNYGIVLFASLRLTENEIILEDLVMSCRVAQKMVETTFLYWCASYAKRINKLFLKINLSMTYKNKPLQQCLESLDLITSSSSMDDSKMLIIDLAQEIDIPQIIKIITIKA